MSLIADSVRLALPSEAERIAAIQRRTWSPDTPGHQLLDRLDLAQMAAAWEAAITRPPLAQFRVLVAVDATAGVVGFAAVGPSDDPDATPDDAEVAEFAIDPAARQRGHGSRLLNAVVDTLRIDGFSRAVWWVLSTDDELRRFLTAAGWDADGAHRQIGTPDSPVSFKQVRLHTDISGGAGGD